MAELLITRGLPASGKTTFAKKWVEEYPDRRARVNRDSIRESVFFQHGVLTPELESQVSRIQRNAVEKLLDAGYSVIVDDMHLRSKYVREWLAVAREKRASVSVIDHFLAVPADECVERDQARIARGERGVTGDVIMGLARKFGNLNPGDVFELTAEENEYTYDPDTSKPKAWMVDLDGTLALMQNRGPFEWHRVGEDALNTPVHALLEGIRSSGYKVVAMSGRDAVCRPQTEEWLDRHGVEHDELFMRAEGDIRNDAIVKLELFREHVAPNYHVIGALDDRPRVCRMWRSIGVFVAQVADPEIEF